MNRKAVHRRSVQSAAVCISQPFSTLYTLSTRTFRVIKRIEKKQMIFLFVSVVVFLYICTHKQEVGTLSSEP